MDKRLCRRIKRNLIKLLMMSLMIIVTTALFVGYYVGTSSVLDSIYKFNDDYNLEDGAFSSLDSSIEGEDIEKMVYKDVPYEDAVVRIFKDREKINLVQIIDGDKPNEINDVLLDHNFMSEHNIDIGDTVKLASTDYNVCGKAISPDYVMTKKSDLILQPNAVLFGVAYVNEDTFSTIDGNELFYYAYKNGKSIEDNVEEYSPLVIKDTANNSRVKQVIGDATSPQLLAIVIVIIFYIIMIILMFVYNYENAKNEKNNVQILRNLGKSKFFIFKHYIKEIFLFGNISTFIGAMIGIVCLPVIMYMNQSIYNYPKLEVSYIKLFFAVCLAFIGLNIVNVLTVWICYFVRFKSKTKKLRFSLLCHGDGSLFHYRYRLTYILRNKKEMLLYTALIFMIGVLINFCFLLKVSVEEYVDNLGKDTPYKYLYFCDEQQAIDEQNCEEIKLYNLYDDNGIIQNVYAVKENSDYFDIEESSVGITKAYADKYEYGVGDSFTLEDKSSGKEYEFKVDRILDVTTVSEVYFNREKFALEDETAYQYGYVTQDGLNDLATNAKSCITKEEVITSGKNILNIINKQITMLMIISVVIEIALMYSLLEFIYSNVYKDVKVLKLNGYSLSELMKMFFGFNTLVCIITVILSFISAGVVVRIFLDNIMFTFINFVKVSQNRTVILLSNGIIIAIYAYFYYRIKSKIKRLENMTDE